MISFLLRVSPLPWFVLNYGFGLLDGMTFCKYVVGLPGIPIILTLYCYLGSTAEDILELFRGTSSLSNFV